MPSVNISLKKLVVVRRLLKRTKLTRKAAHTGTRCTAKSAGKKTPHKWEAGENRNKNIFFKAARRNKATLN